MTDLNEKLLSVIIGSKSKATLGEAFREAFLYKFHNAKEQAKINYIKNKTVRERYSVIVKDVKKLKKQLNGYPVKQGDKLTAVDRNLKTNVKASKDRIYVLAGLRGYLEVDKDAVHVVNEGRERFIVNLLKQHGVHYAKFRYGAIHVPSSTIAKKVKQILDLDTGVHYTPDIHSPGLSYTGSTKQESVNESHDCDQTHPGVTHEKWKKYHSKTKQEAVVNWKAEANAADIAQKKIAIDTVKNPAKSLLGGPSEEESIKILKGKYHYTDAQIKKLKETVKIKTGMPGF